MLPLCPDGFISLGYIGDYFPIFFKDGAKFDGVSVRIFEDVAWRFNCSTVKLIEFKKYRSLAAVQRGEILTDITTGGLSTPRMKEFHYSLSLYVDTYSFYEATNNVTSEAWTPLIFFIVYQPWTLLLIFICLILIRIVTEQNDRLKTGFGLWIRYAASGMFLSSILVLIILHGAVFKGNTIYPSAASVTFIPHDCTEFQVEAVNCKGANSINPIPGEFTYKYPPTPHIYSYFFSKKASRKVIEYVNFLTLTLYSDDNVDFFWTSRLLPSIKQKPTTTEKYRTRPVTVASLGWIFTIFASFHLFSISSFFCEFLVFRTLAAIKRGEILTDVTSDTFTAPRIKKFQQSLSLYADTVWHVPLFLSRTNQYVWRGLQRSWPELLADLLKGKRQLFEAIEDLQVFKQEQLLGEGKRSTVTGSVDSTIDRMCAHPRKTAGLFYEMEIYTARLHGSLSGTCKLQRIEPIPGEFSYKYPPTLHIFGYFFSTNTSQKVINYVNFLTLSIYSDDNVRMLSDYIYHA
ncbi:hypothetical protein PRIPAC_87073 [Pristionchus pacificus]|uniref:Uncharacterized protein n=1 Tax=Pristionchus pacificus TaxID=54126 RepID=A0A2A6BMJ4_PRIPA|nr:hypothetical protein PRIPAC_87073 [Pristionchus pacificus]|eukprot:PDM67023.1 hypothetical protein PRIPAC_48440 [Pristionchus pacificus]